MKVSVCFLATLFSGMAVERPALAQTISDPPVIHARDYRQIISSFVEDHSGLNQNVSSNSNDSGLSKLHNYPVDDSSKNDQTINPIPVFVFGLTGMFLGAWVGHSIEDKGNIPGEPGQVFTKGTVIGMGAGLVAGGLVGYFLGKEKSQNDSHQLKAGKR